MRGKIKKHTGNNKSSEKLSTGATATLDKTVIDNTMDRLTGLYESVEKPIGNLVQKVGKTLPKNLKSYSPGLMTGVVPFFSMALLVFGFLKLYKVKNL